MMRQALGAMAVLVLSGAPATSPDLRFWPFATDAERLIEEAALARRRLDFTAASNLLDEASKKDSQLEAAIGHERGLITLDRGDPERAYTLLKRAADLDGTSSARIDAAGVLVQLGRWPEAIVVLRQAFEERGTSLSVEQIIADKRFAKLAALKPYQEVINAARVEQAGPLGRVLARLERLQLSFTAAEHGLQRVGAWISVFRDLAIRQSTLVALFIFLGFAITFGVNQLNVFKPPWALGVGLIGASVVWTTICRAIGDGSRSGYETILGGWAAHCLLLVIGMVTRWGWYRFQTRRRGAADPFAAEHLAETLMLVDEVSRLGHRVVGSQHRQQRVLSEALRQAGETLRQRLDRGSN